jgi:hypothetical protein
LAEGADRLVAACVLEWKGQAKSQVLLPPELEIVLPMPEDKYFETFATESRAESITAFRSFVAVAAELRELPDRSDRHEAYTAAGRYVVEHCHVLIAIWDGRNSRGKGGTAEIVQFAKSCECSIFWINARNGKAKPIRMRGLVRDAEFLDEYNREPVSSLTMDQEVRRRMESLKQVAQAEGLNPAVLDPLACGIFPHFVKATSLAARYQNLYFTRSVEIPYLLSALAVTTAALGAIVIQPEVRWHDIPAQKIVFGVEALQILLVLWMSWPGKRQIRQRKWINYRYLAERLRSSIFLYVAGLREQASAAPPDLHLTWLPDQWLTIALRELWKPLGPIEPSQDQGSMQRFLQRAWILHQQKWYHKTGASNHKVHRWIEAGSVTLILATLGAAILHVILPHDNPAALCLSVLAVSLPAVASSLAGISVFRNFNRNAERYESMSRYLEEIGKRMERGEPSTAPEPLPHLTALQQVVQEADATMAREHQSWRAVIGVHLPGPG